VLLTDNIKKVFVTGGAGFIGSHVVDTLLSEGYEVTAYDNLSSGKLGLIKHNLDKQGFQFVQGDLLDFDALKKAMAKHDLVWHLAANTDIPGGYVNTDIDLKNCAIGTYNTVEAMRQNEIVPIIFSSTGAIYGESCRREAVTENIGPLLPLSLYAAGKIASEGFISAYCSLFNLRGWMFRFGNVIGARMGHGVIYDFVEKLRRNPNELEILGDGAQEKNYFLVEECINGMAHAFKNAVLSADKPCDLFNLGTDSTTKVTTIAQVVIEEMGLTDVKIRFTGGERGWPGDQPQVHILSNRMHEMGWYTQHTSDEAVRIAVRRLVKN
jgi:UDP-glucose 4-epimerase